MSGVDQVNIEYLEVVGAGAAAGAGVAQVALDYLEVLGAATVAGAGLAQVDLEYLEVIGSAIPAAPSPVSLQNSILSMILTWGAANGATGYLVFQGTTSGGEVQVASLSSATLSYTATGLRAGQVYYFYVIATTAVGNTGQSAEVFATASETSPIQQMSPLLEDGGCFFAYYSGAPNCYVKWTVSAGSITPCSNYTDASGIVCAYYNPQATSGGVRLLEGRPPPPMYPSRRLLEGGAGVRLLEGTSGAYFGEQVTIVATSYIP